MAADFASQDNSDNRITTLQTLPWALKVRRGGGACGFGKGAGYR